MSRADFDAFVKRQHTDDGLEDRFDAASQLSEWLRYLNELYQKVAGFLAPYTSNGSANISRREIHLNEEFAGDYTAPELVVVIGRSTVTFIPIGTMLIGMKGRVDVEGPHGRARLVLINREIRHARELIRVTVSRVGESRPAIEPPKIASKVDWAWKLSSPPPEMKFEELTQDTFFDMILAIANG
jgi:hypothetical protein